ncbi:hypothetical protein EF847_01545 [Actinobacteria bacterium YIM 96077]|uniref:Uncharacterized protein n=2 Tax=Phytoactinopolyspora halophila TaxID=1981511 RepID=A0A329QGR9_9ACTN|nr:hypothetical protein EF847_01545 [Actinobacteria bacterium YIM 96077]RAW11151.1 hypothetical protein DPM12_17570 [Phytoactinopolyspora halophila]
MNITFRFRVKRDGDGEYRVPEITPRHIVTPRPSWDTVARLALTDPKANIRVRNAMRHAGIPRDYMSDSTPGVAITGSGVVKTIEFTIPITQETVR